MWPSSCLIRCGVNARTPWITPHRLTPRIHCQSAGVFSHTAPSGDTPALLHTTCTPPSRVSVWSRKISSCWAFETSTLSVMARTPFASTSSCTEERLTSSTSASARSMPSAAKASAIERPRPLAAPVTAATLPCRSLMALSSERVPQHGAAAEQDQDFHEHDVQLSAHARDQPCRNRTAGNAGEPDHHAGEEGLGIEQVETLEQRRLADVEDDRDHRIGREHRRGGEPRAEQQGDQDHAGAGGHAGGEAEHARSAGDAERAELHLLRVEDAAHRHRGDHRETEDHAEGTRVEDAVDPRAEHQERQRGGEYQGERAPVEVLAVEPETAGVDDD